MNFFIKNNNLLKIFNFGILSLTVIAFSLFVISGCENSPTNLGQQYLPGDDTLFTKILDSQIDTMAINSRIALHYVNTYSSTRLLVGNYQSYQSFSFLKFVDFPTTYDSCTVLSAKMYLTYGNYSFYDSNGVTAFNVYRVIDTVAYDTITYNGYRSSLVGSTVLGSYSGNPQNYAKIEVPLDPATVREWLLLNANAQYPYTNFGIALVPQGSATNIKGFYNYFSAADSLKPVLKAIVLKNQQQDTLTMAYTVSVNFGTYNGSAFPNDRFIIQPGVSYWSVLNFDLRKLPSNVTINEAQLTFTLDKGSSSIAAGSDGRVRFALLTDTSTLATDGYYYYTTTTDSVTYTIYLNQILQRWNFNISPNLGVLLNYIYDGLGMDKYVFFGPNYSDVSKRPRLKIRYTPRDNPIKNQELQKHNITNE